MWGIRGVGGQSQQGVGYQRASRASRGVGTSGGQQGVGVSGTKRGCTGCQEALRVAEDVGTQGASRGIGGVGGIRGLAGDVGALGWQVDWEPDHIGPKSRVPALPLIGV